MPTNNSFQIFKGLQKPLELFGIRGRFLIYGAFVVLFSFLGYILCGILVNKLAGFGAFAMIAGLGYGLIRLKQREGLHKKKRNREIFIYHSMYKIN